MRILYDYQAFSMQTHGGISRCFAELLKHIPNGVDTKLGVKESDNVYLSGIDNIMPANYQYNNFLGKKHFLGKWHMHYLYDKISGGGYYPNYNKNYSIELLKKGDYDVFHPTYFDDYFLPFLNGKPFVLTIHDMIPELYPQYFTRDDKQIKMKQKLISLASGVIAVSENTKNDIIRMMNVPQEKIHVVYHGCSFATTIQKKEKPYNFPYILFVGGRGDYKNFYPFMKAIMPILRKYNDLHVVCTGKPFNEDEINNMNALGIKDRFLYSWVKNDDSMLALYHQAECFVFPSEYEGFGLPILEAYQAECPVLLNNASCFPEIAGDAAVYFNMNSDDTDLAEKLELLLMMSSSDRNALLEKQKLRLARYSWEESAKRMADIYQSICS